MSEIKVTSDVNGMVRTLEVAPGDKIEMGETILVLDCMKMEIPVFAPKAGTLKTILTKEGATVTEGQTLAIIEA